MIICKHHRLDDHYYMETVVFPFDKEIDVYRWNEGHKYELFDRYQYPDQIIFVLFYDLENWMKSLKAEYTSDYPF